MKEICIKIPEDLKTEFSRISGIELSILFTEFIRERLSKAEMFRQIVSKSKLTQEDADKLSNEMNKSLAKRYESLK